MKRVGLALGGGGARGIAHIAYLKAMEELGVRPSIISGTSSGALAGALYAGGLSADDIYGIVQNLFGEKKNIKYALKRLKLMSSVFVSSVVEKSISDILPKRSFEELDIPIKIVATNLDSYSETVFERGDVLQALMGSIAYPRVIGPQLVEGEYYIDGGATNILPFDIIRKECDLLIAVDVSLSKPRQSSKPNLRNSMRATWAAMQNTIITMKLENSPVEILERPYIDGVSTMDFHKYIYIYECTQQFLPDFKDRLEKLL